MSAERIRLEPGWKSVLIEEFEKPYFRELRAFLVAERGSGNVIYPPGDLIFHAFDSTPFDQVKVVILGQDPYHGPGQAHGLCFSVPDAVPPPPSLKNIYKELQADLGIPPATTGNLTGWARQGVLLLNSVLTVRANTPASHAGKGWETFTDAAIRLLNDHRENLVFMLWGNYAQKKGAFLNPNRHLILKAAHPSPLSAHNGFLGCRHFSRTNDYLVQHHISPVNWNLP